jgi:hypothetical protein
VAVGILAVIVGLEPSYAASVGAGCGVTVSSFAECEPVLWNCEGCALVHVVESVELNSTEGPWLEYVGILGFVSGGSFGGRFSFRWMNRFQAIG